MTSDIETTGHEITRLLDRWRAEDGDALDRLLSLLYEKQGPCASHWLGLSWIKTCP